MKNNIGNNTKCVHSGTIIDELTGGVNTPVYVSTSNSFDKDTGLVYYPRYLNLPNQKAIAEKLCTLENGEEAIVLASGMAAITVSLFALLGHGDHALFAPSLYGGTHHFIVADFEKFGIEYSFAASEKADDFEKAIKNNTKIIYIETPSNPLLKITDIKAVAELAQSKGIITIIDNTFASPINQRPLDLGIDISIHSATKYLNGHSDLNAGIIVSSKEIMAKVQPFAVNQGGTLNAQCCYLLERGLKTLALRIRQHNENALKLAQYLENHKFVKKVYYPGLESHEDHQLAKSQMSGFGGMLSFELNCDKVKTKEILSKLKLFKNAGSLGGVESLVTLPCETSHKKMCAEERCKAGIGDALIRVSVGIEDIEDLIADMDQAFKN